MKRRAILLTLLAILLLAAGIAYRRLTSAPNLNTTTATIALPAPGSEDDKTRQALLGVWQDNYQGKRTMTLNHDGTGTMLVELKGAAAFLYADKLRFDMTWSLEGKKLTKKTVGGEPASKVNLIINTMGDTATDTILELTADRLLLLDKDGKTQYDWRRVKTEEKAKP